MKLINSKNKKIVIKGNNRDIFKDGLKYYDFSKSIRRIYKKSLNILFTTKLLIIKLYKHKVKLLGVNSFFLFPEASN